MAINVEIVEFNEEEYPELSNNFLEASKLSFNTTKIDNLFFTPEMVEVVDEVSSQEDVNKQLTVSKSNYIKCKLCFRRFCDRAKLKVHLKYHQNLKLFKCDQCGKAFVERNCLVKHFKVHSDLRPFSCEHCGKTFKQKWSLFDHLDTHMKNPDNKCSQCNNSFETVKDLQEHLIIHESTKRFMCNICEIKGFNSRAELRRHLRIHTREKPYECMFCNTRFSQKQHLNRHVNFTCKMKIKN